MDKERGAYSEEAMDLSSPPPHPHIINNPLDLLSTAAAMTVQQQRISQNTANQQQVFCFQNPSSAAAPPPQAAPNFVSTPMVINLPIISLMRSSAEQTPQWGNYAAIQSPTPVAVLPSYFPQVVQQDKSPFTFDLQPNQPIYQQQATAGHSFRQQEAFPRTMMQIEEAKANEESTRQIKRQISRSFDKPRLSIGNRVQFYSQNPLMPVKIDGNQVVELLRKKQVPQKGPSVQFQVPQRSPPVRPPPSIVKDMTRLVSWAQDKSIAIPQQRLVRPPPQKSVEYETLKLHYESNPVIEVPRPPRVSFVQKERQSVISINPNAINQLQQGVIPQTTSPSPVVHSMDKLQRMLKSLTPPPPTTTILQSLPDISVSPSPVTLLPSFGETFAHQQFTACLQSPVSSTVIKQETISTPPPQKRKRTPRKPKEISPPQKKPKVPLAPRRKKNSGDNLTIDESKSDPESNLEDNVLKQAVNYMSESSRQLALNMPQNKLIPNPAFIQEIPKLEVKIDAVITTTPSCPLLPILEDTKVTLINSPQVIKTEETIPTNTELPSPNKEEEEVIIITPPPPALPTSNTTLKRRPGRKSAQESIAKRRKTDEGSVNVKKGPAPSKKKPPSSVASSVNATRKWYPNEEERKVLYGDLCFLVESINVAKPRLETILWRIYEVEDRIVLKKYEPLDLSGRELHRATDRYLMFNEMDEHFYNRFQPVFTLKLIDTAIVSVFHYLNQERITPQLLKIKDTEDLFPHFKWVVELIFRELITGNDDFIKDKITDGHSEFDQFSKTSWNLIQKECTERAKSLCDCSNLPAEFIIPFCQYPVTTLSKYVGKRIYCGACSENKIRTAHFKVNFKFKPYDPLTFNDLPEPPNNDRYLCYTCKPILVTMSRILHYNWHVYLAIRGYVSHLILELDPDEKLDANDTIKSLVDDYEWIIKGFVDYQIILAEADKEIERLSKKAVKTNS